MKFRIKVQGDLDGSDLIQFGEVISQFKEVCPPKEKRLLTKQIFLELLGIALNLFLVIKELIDLLRGLL